VAEGTAGDKEGDESMFRLRILPLVAALACVMVPGVALARGGGGGGGHGGGGHAGGGGHFGGGGGGHFAGGGHFGGIARGAGFGGALPRAYVGPRTWGAGPHWGRGFWGWGGGGWIWYGGPWWVAPQYPGWIWIGPQWVWDGQQWVWQEGYWTRG